MLTLLCDRVFSWLYLDSNFKAGQFTCKGDLTNVVNFVPGSIRSPWGNLFHIRLRKSLILILNLQFIESVTKIEVSIDYWRHRILFASGGNCYSYINFIKFREIPLCQSFPNKMKSKSCALFVIAVTAVASPQQQIPSKDKFFFLSLLKNGAIWPAPDLLRLLGPVPDSKTFTMSTFVLYGTLHGRFGGLRQAPSQVPGMPGRTSDSLQWNTRISHKCYLNQIFGFTCRNHRYCYQVAQLRAQPCRAITHHNKNTAAPCRAITQS